ncbi:MAG: HypC/HybG/HupF family hydrogenase formation chaperone [Deltaproteobacteria bacterium]|nr:HypC/HybG/HupF family hydrogenase formation chaperone [Deltaproteobacteria bacterium]
MCLGVPVRVMSISGTSATAEVGGARREISVMLLEDVREGDWVILHAGFAISKLSPEEAEKTLQYLREIRDAT